VSVFHWNIDVFSPRVSQTVALTLATPASLVQFPGKARTDKNLKCVP